MSGYYPAGVTGNEEQICGSGTEDKCEWCISDKAGTGFPLNAIAESVTEISGEHVCEECATEFLQSHGVSIGEIKLLGKQDFIRDMRKYLKEQEAGL